MFNKSSTEQTPFRFNLGAKVRDKITGYEGIVVSRSDWLNGCVRHLVQAEYLSSENKTIEIWVDEPQLEFLQNKHPGNFWPADEETGEKPRRAGPRNDPQR
mgnify:CR=1 FL=1